MPETARDILVVGLSHRTAEPALRDRLFLESAALPDALARLARRGIVEGLLLSTCDRCEVLAVAEPDAGAAIAEELAALAGVPQGELAASLYRLKGAAAIRHVFAVAASLDSPVVGEPQVLGQVKAAHRLAAEAGMVGGELAAVLAAAYAAAKRVRSETAVAEQPVSIAAAAVQVARRVHGDLARAAALMIGVGEMGEMVVEQLRKAGLGRLTVAHPSARRAELAARRFGCHFMALDEVWTRLGEADIIVGALGAGRPAVSASAVAEALRHRRRRPVLLIDAALPGDIEPAVDNLAEAFRYDLGDLEGVAMQGRAERAAAAVGGWAVVDAAVADFLRSRAERAAVPALVALRRHFEAARVEALALGGDAAGVTNRLINRLLHEPSQALREIAAADREAAERLLRRLYQLGERESDEE